MRERVRSTLEVLRGTVNVIDEDNDALVQLLAVMTPSSREEKLRIMRAAFE